MRDQAESLREQLKRKNSKIARTIAVVSGKGGVGKSNISINMAIALAHKGKKVLIFDFDIGMGNIHILLGEDSKKTISDFLHNHASIRDILYTGPHNISYISAGNGFSKILELDDSMVSKLLDGLEEILCLYDFIVFDMGAGATSANLQILLSVEDVFVITTPEPTSITDAYSMMKYISNRESNHHFYLICNRSEKEKEGYLTLERLQLTMRKFLNMEIKLLGVLPEDPHVRKAVIRQVPFYTEYPRSYVTDKLEKIVQAYLGEEKIQQASAGANSFLRKLRKLFLKGTVDHEEN